MQPHTPYKKLSLKIGVRELKERMAEILRRVQEDDQTYEITQRGKVVARLTPAWWIEGRELLKEYERWNAEMDALAADIAKLNNDPRDCVEIMRDERS